MRSADKRMISLLLMSEFECNEPATNKAIRLRSEDQIYLLNYLSMFRIANGGDGFVEREIDAQECRYAK
jgi:hypothetical protein